MINFPRTVGLALVVLFTGATATAAQAAAPSVLPDVFGRLNLDTLHWSGKPGGVQLAWVEGNPMVPDKPYTVALKIGDGVWIQPHWHPRTQHVAVVRGTLLLGHGEALDSAAALRMPLGSVGEIPAEARHYEGGGGSTIALLYGIGPMTTTFVKPPTPLK